MSLTIGQSAPLFDLPAVSGDRVALADSKGRNVLLAFFPMAWTPVCSHQIPALNADLQKFSALDCDVFALSIDHVPALKAWLATMGNICFPVLSDFWPHGKVAEAYGVLRPEGYTERALFIIDRQGIIRYIDIHDIDDQPSNETLLKELMSIDPEAAQKAQLTEEPEPEMPHSGVIMYYTQWCPDSKRARIWLDAQHIAYQMVDINKNPSIKPKIREWAGGNLTTPTFDIDGTIVVDFDEVRLREVLKDRMLR